MCTHKSCKVVFSTNYRAKLTNTVRVVHALLQQTFNNNNIINNVKNLTFGFIVILTSPSSTKNMQSASSP